jgi:hypothetical protein
MKNPHYERKQQNQIQMTNKELVLKSAKAQGLSIPRVLLKKHKVGTLFWAIHHSNLVEATDEPIINRVDYILNGKSSHERKIRLAAMRPVKNPDKVKEIQSASNAVIEELHCQRRVLTRSEEVKRDEALKALGDRPVPTPEYYVWRHERNKVVSHYHAEADRVSVELEKKIFEVRKNEREQLLALWDSEYPKHPKWDKDGLVFNSPLYASRTW